MDKNLYWGTLLLVDGTKVESFALMSINDSQEQAVGQQYEAAKKANPGRTVVVNMTEVPFTWQLTMREHLLKQFPV